MSCSPPLDDVRPRGHTRAVSRSENWRTRHRTRPCAWGFAAVVAMGFQAREGRADGERPAATLEWDAPSDCPSGPEAMNRIQQAVGRSDLRRDPVRARVLVHAEPGGGWRAEVELAVEGARERRSLEGASCRQVVDAIVVMIAMVAAVEPESPASPPPVAPRATVPPRIHDKVARKALGLGLSADIDLGTLPSTALGGGIRLDWDAPRADVGIVVDAASSANGTLAEQPHQGASFWLARARARGCYPMLGAALTAGPCAGIGAEAVVANGFGSTHPSNAIAWLPMVSFGGQVVLWLTPWLSLHLVGEGSVLPVTRSFVIDDAGTVHRPATLTFGAAFGEEIHF